MNGLNFFIKFDEIKLSNKVGEGGKIIKITLINKTFEFNFSKNNLYI
jgi:hypothetical protein